MVLPFCRQPFGMALLVVAACVQGALVYVGYRLADTGRVSLTVGTVVVVALFLRSPFLFSPPLLSDDITRYLFDGMVQQAGDSPYAVSPEAYETTNPIVSDLATKVNHPHLVTLYPPAAQLFFRLAAPLGMTGMKALLVLADMAVVGLLLLCLPRLGLPRHGIILYAWNPMVVWEIAWSGHIDALALPFLLVAGLLVVGKGRRETIMAGVLFAVALWVKLIPVIFGLFFLLASRRRMGWFAAGGAMASALLVVPYLPQMGNGVETLVLYGTTWEFSGFLFRTIRDLTGINLVARLVTALLFCGGAGALLWRQWRTKMSHFHALGWAAFFWLLTTPTLHPWYGLYLAMFLPLMGDTFNGKLLAPFLLTLTPLFGYVVLTNFFAHGVWVEGTWTPFLVFAIPLMALAISKEPSVLSDVRGKSMPPAAR